MSKVLYLLLASLLCYSGIAQNLKYPEAPKENITNAYFGEKVVDPYQWMENPSDPRLESWLVDQKGLTRKYENRRVNSFVFQDQISRVGRTRYDDFNLTANNTDKKYYFKTQFSDSDSPADLYYKIGKDGDYVRLVYAKKLRADKNDDVIITDWEVDPDEKFVIVSVSHSGSDWQEQHVYNLETKEATNDIIKYTRGAGLIWKSNGFYYIRYDKPKEGRELLDRRTGQRICFHRMGTTQDEDQVVYTNPDISGVNSLHYFKSGENEVILSHPIKYRGLWKRTFSTVNMEGESFLPKPFFILPSNTSFDIECIFGDSVVMKTDMNAPKHKIVIALKNEVNKIFEIVPEYMDNLVTVNRLGKDKIAGIYSLNGKYTVLVFDLNGKILKRYSFAEGKKVSGFYADEDQDYAYYYVSSFYHPSIKFRIKLSDLSAEPMGVTTLPFNHENFVTKYVEYISKDSTAIQAYITYDKRLDLSNGDNPCLILGYGGYGHTIEPSYNWENIIWLMNGGILVTPNIRGGGAQGGDWAKAGRKLLKQNAFDDFTACADYLMESGITNPNKIAIIGGSHGGMLVAAVAVQHPEKFKAVVASAGVYDMLRAENFTVSGAAINRREYGTVTDSVEFANLYSYSPYHNLKKGKFPSIMLITGDHDDRVPPLHSYKFLARIQEMYPETTAILKIKENTGHSKFETLDGYYDIASSQYMFLFNELDMDFKR
ncbi:alpha/beta fold hydrolase [Fulvivirga ligni]|uniref:alpha/beta fold hydrolase n=1 Tax=Fulvivirga ligni TaxID=2904246 RepID=UPI001F2CA7CE|nr:alpha/beta fold hydrolase [Fulvivirga ligni]UII22361.1 alpha/beta fold hydrolase [Fulvivirga ligni]